MLLDLLDEMSAERERMYRGGLTSLLWSGATLTRGKEWKGALLITDYGAYVTN